MALGAIMRVFIFRAGLKVINADAREYNTIGIRSDEVLKKSDKCEVTRRPRSITAKCLYSSAKMPECNSPTLL